MKSFFLKKDIAARAAFNGCNDYTQLSNESQQLAVVFISLVKEERILCAVKAKITHSLCSLKHWGLIINVFMPDIINSEQICSSKFSITNLLRGNLWSITFTILPVCKLMISFSLFSNLRRWDKLPPLLWQHT